MICDSAICQFTSTITCLALASIVLSALLALIMRFVYMIGFRTWLNKRILRIWLRNKMKYLSRNDKWRPPDNKDISEVSHQLMNEIREGIGTGFESAVFRLSYPQICGQILNYCQMLD